MVTVPIKDEYFEILTALGDLQSGVDLALQRFALERITTKIAELREQDTAYQSKYGLDYPTFARRTVEDEEFLEHVEREVEKMWEADLSDWEFCFKGVEDWTRKLPHIF